jgi:hypothetical protein
MEKSKFVTRAYNKIEKLSNGRILKSSSSSRLADEINYYNSIPLDVSFLFPRKFTSVTTENNNSMVLEYYPYNTLGEYIISDLPINWHDVFINLKGCLDLFKNIKDDNQSTTDYANSMYLDKTLNEYISFKTSFKDYNLFESDTLIINGVEYKNFKIIWRSSIINKILNTLLNYESTMIHGDMCFSNILYNEKVGSRFIDMRGSFGKRSIYGDRLYDLAKLSHSVDGGYEFFINDKFTVNKTSVNQYELNIQETNNKKLASEAYWNSFSNENKSLTKLIEGLIYVGMCARHYDSSERQLAMYLTGIKNLNQIL